MLRLAMLLYALTATIFAATGVIATLTVADDDAPHLATAFALGLVIALPVSWLVARNIHQSLNGRL